MWCAYVLYIYIYSGYLVYICFSCCMFALYCAAVGVWEAHRFNSILCQPPAPRARCGSVCFISWRCYWEWSTPPLPWISKRSRWETHPDSPIIILYARLFWVSVVFALKPSYEYDTLSFPCLSVFQLNKINLLITSSSRCIGVFSLTWNCLN